MKWIKTDLQSTTTEYQRLDTKATWEIEVQNSKEIDVALDIRRIFQGDWSIETQAATKKMDATKIKFIVPLKPKEKRTLAYTATSVMAPTHQVEWPRLLLPDPWGWAMRIADCGLLLASAVVALTILLLEPAADARINVVTCPVAIPSSSQSTTPSI